MAFYTLSHYTYRKKLGTFGELLDISYLVQENLDKAYETWLIQVDFSVMFDLVSHNALIIKLKQIGFGSRVLDVLTDFLCVRQQALVNSAASDLEPVVSGVHQGSVLGPLLFLIYIYIYCWFGL